MNWMKMSLDKKQLIKRRRRWFQLRLRTLLVIFTLASVTIGWVVFELEQRRGEVLAIAWAEAQLDTFTWRSGHCVWFSNLRL